MRNKAYKFRIYPTTEQESLVQRTFGCARFVWNLMLADAKKSYSETKKFDYPTPATYKREHEFLSKVDSMSLCNAQQNLIVAFSRFFKDRKDKKKKRKSGFPKFKKKRKTRKSYTTNCINNSVRIEQGKLRLPKLGLLETVFHRRVEGRIKGATVSQDPSGKYFVSVLTEQLDLPKPKIDESKVIGLDFSFHSLFVTHTGARPKHFVENFKRVEVKLAREKRWLSRKEFGSHGYEKQKIKVAKVEEKNRNFRKDFFHKCVKQILDRYDVVVIEDIDLVGMAKRGKHRKFGASIYRLGFGMFREILKSKAEERGKLVVVANKWFPSSQLCSSCGYRNKGTKDLSIRKWKCPDCNSIHDRDVNAAQNLVNYYVHEQDRTEASSGNSADGDPTSTSSLTARSKLARRTRKSCRTVDPTSPFL